MTYLVTGGRNFSKRVRLYAVLDALGLTRADRVVHGACPTGADAMTHEWCARRGVPVYPYPADWAAFGPAAGPIRNGQMLVDQSVDKCIAFPGGDGTADMIERCEEAGVPVERVVI